MTLRDLINDNVKVDRSTIIEHIPENGMPMICSILAYSDDVVDKPIKEIYVNKKYGTLIIRV